MTESSSSLSRRRFGTLAGLSTLGAVGSMSSLVTPARAQKSSSSDKVIADVRSVSLGNPVNAEAGTLVDVFQLLIEDHRRVARIFERILQTANTEADYRDDLFKSLFLSLRQHADAEENVVYPALRQYGFESEARELFSEHADMKTYLYALRISPKNTDAWLSILQDLKADVQEHVSDEEDNAFPELRSRLNAKQIAQLSALIRLEHY